MKMSSLLSTVALFLAAMMLSGCIFPYWYDDDGYGHGGGRHHEGGHRGGGHEGGGRH